MPARLWPSPKQELILRTTFAPEPEARAAWEALRAGLDIDRLEDGSYALMPLLCRRLEGWSTDEPLVQRLRSIYRHTWYRGNLLLQRLVDVLGVAGDAGLPVVLLGAPRLLLRTYRDPGLRPSSRIDLLVKPADVTKLTAALVGAGWRRTGPSNPGQTVWLEHPNAPALALERRLLPQRGPAEVEDTPVRVELRGVTHEATSTTAELLRTCVGSERRFVWNRLQWVADATLLLRNEGEDVDWDRALGLAQAHGATLTLRDAVLYASELADAPVADEIVARLAAIRPTARDAIAQRLGRFDRSHLYDRVPAPVRSALRKVIPAR